MCFSWKLCSWIVYCVYRLMQICKTLTFVSLFSRLFLQNEGQLKINVVSQTCNKLQNKCKVVHYFFLPKNGDFINYSWLIYIIKQSKTCQIINRCYALPGWSDTTNWPTSLATKQWSWQKHLFAIIQITVGCLYKTK